MNTGRIEEPVLAGSLVGAEPWAGEPLTVECPHCGRQLLSMRGLWVQSDEEDPLYDAVRGLERVCDCEAARVAAEEERRAQEAAERLERARQERRVFEGAFAGSGMPGAFRERGLSRWVRECEDQQRAFDAVVEFGRQLVAGGRPGGLFVAGDIGTGKTFLVSCLAVDLLRRGRVVRWSSVSQVLREIRGTFGTRESEEAVIRRYCRPGLLVLDDLGKERPTEWALEQLFCIVNARYEEGRALVVTSNYGGEELVRRLTPRAEYGAEADDTTARAIVDRLRGMCFAVQLTGRSWRGAGAAEVVPAGELTGFLLG